MNKELTIILTELKQQHSWRLEEVGCGNCEVEESWDKTKCRIIDTIKYEGYYDERIVDLIESF